MELVITPLRCGEGAGIRRQLHFFARAHPRTLDTQPILPVCMNDTPMKFLPEFNGFAISSEVGHAYQNTFADKPVRPHIIPTRFISRLQGRKLG